MAAVNTAVNGDGGFGGDDGGFGGDDGDGGDGGDDVSGKTRAQPRSFLSTALPPALLLPLHLFAQVWG